MTDRIRTLNADISDSEIRLEELEGALDLASDQDQRTAVVSGGRTVAAIVPAGDLTRLQALDAAVLSGQPGTSGRPEPDVISREIRSDGMQSPVSPDITVVNASSANLRAELDYRNQPDVYTALGMILEGLNSPDHIVTRIIQAQAALRALRDQIRQGPGAGPSKAGILARFAPPAPTSRDPAPELTAMTRRLAELIRTLGITCDAAGMSQRSPAEIARWLRYGDDAP